MQVHLRSAILFCVLVLAVGYWRPLVAQGMLNLAVIDYLQTHPSTSDLPAIERLLKQGADIAPTTGAYRLLGDIYLARGDLERALATLAAGLRLTPTDSLLLLKQGLAYERRGEHAQAMQSWRLARAGIWFARQGQARLEQGRIEEAASLLDIAVQLDAGSPDIFHVLGQLRRSQRRYEDAAWAFERAVSLAPGTGEHEYFLARALAEAGRWHEALGICEEVVAKNMRRRVIACLLLKGMYFETQGDVQRARYWYEKASSTGDPTARQALEHLNQDKEQ